MDFFNRSKIILSEEDLRKINKSSVLIFGLGGVGCCACESLVRAGIGKIGICDGDSYDESNLNRQIYATNQSLNKIKVDVAYDRIKSIRDIEVSKYPFDYNEKTVQKINFSEYSYIIDAIDTIASKILIIERARNENIKIISAMGTGNKFDPTKFKIDYIEKTSYDPLARILRKELRKRNIKNLPVVYSEEIPVKTKEGTPGSISFVPPVCGFILTSYVIRDIIGKEVFNGYWEFKW